MKTIGIVQPGRLGDIIICLPIAKYYRDKGYEVVWPIFDYLVDMIQERVKYVKFIPVTSNVYKCVEESKKKLTEIHNIVIFDIAATFPGSDCTKEYVSLGDGFGEEKFDEFKYRKCSVPFEEKWNLNFIRSKEQEDQVYHDVVTNPDYNIIGTTYSRGKIDIQFVSKYLNIEINQNYNFFSWYRVLKDAKTIVLVDSAMANFVEQTKLPNKKILITKPGEPRPYFKNNWVIKNI